MERISPLKFRRRRTFSTASTSAVTDVRLPTSAVHDARARVRVRCAVKRHARFHAATMPCEARRQTRMLRCHQTAGRKARLAATSPTDRTARPATRAPAQPGRRAHAPKRERGPDWRVHHLRTVRWSDLTCRLTFAATGARPLRLAKRGARARVRVGCAVKRHARFHAATNPCEARRQTRMLRRRQTAGRKARRAARTPTARTARPATRGRAQPGRRARAPTPDCAPFWQVRHLQCVRRSDLTCRLTSRFRRARLHARRLQPVVRRW